MSQPDSTGPEILPEVDREVRSLIPSDIRNPPFETEPISFR